jgi:hypothetical protein
MTCSAKRNREARAAPPEGQAGRGGDNAEKLGDGEPRGGAGARSLFKRPREEEVEVERERERERDLQSAYTLTSLEYYVVSDTHRNNS